MIGVGWFERKGQWHTLRADDPKTTECGIQFLHEPKVILSTKESPAPPNPCSTCFVAIGMREVDDEPLDDALARGFESVGFFDEGSGVEQ